MVNGNDIDSVKQKVEQIKGSKYTTDDLIIYLFERLQEKVDSVCKKFDKHLVWSNNELVKGHTVLNEHEKILQHITDELPSKGFCDDVEVIRMSWFQDKKSTIGDKVRVLWYDRKLMKWVVGLIVTTLIVSAASLIVNSGL